VREAKCEAQRSVGGTHSRYCSVFRARRNLRIIPRKGRPRVRQLHWLGKKSHSWLEIFSGGATSHFSYKFSVGRHSPFSGFATRQPSGGCHLYRFSSHDVAGFELCPLNRPKGDTVLGLNLTLTGRLHNTSAATAGWHLRKTKNPKFQSYKSRILKFLHSTATKGSNV